MRIAQMLDTLSMGGAQQMQVFLVETLHPLGIELTIISLSDSSNSPLVSKLREAGAQVVDFPFHQLFSPRNFVRLVNYLRAEKFDLLHAYLTYSNIVGPLAGMLSGTPVIASLRNADFEGKSYTPQRAALETFSMRYLAKRVMANGLAVAKVARHRLHDSRPVDIIPNAVELVPALAADERVELRRQLVGDPTRPLILSVGRLTLAKGFHDLVEAFALIHSRMPSAVLVIAGGGDLMNEINAHAQRMGLDGHLFLLGRRADVPRLLAAADFYVNSSHWEGTPVSVLEAMAAGLPVVATKVGENPYLLADGAGLLVDAHAPIELAEALLTLLAAPQKADALGQAARQRISSQYTRHMWRQKILTLYAQITPQAKSYLDQVSSAWSNVGEA